MVVFEGILLEKTTTYVQASILHKKKTGNLKLKGVNMGRQEKVQHYETLRDIPEC